MPIPSTLIVCAGGGLQASFIAGALNRLEKDFPDHITTVPHIFATSASMATVIYYLSFQHNHPGEYIWTQAVPNSAFFTSLANLRTGQPVYDVDHLIDIVFKQNHPLDLNTLKATPVHFVFPALNLQTRQTELFSNRPDLTRTFFPHHIIHDWREHDIYELMRAALAIPILYDKPIAIGPHTYCDSGLFEPFLIPDAIPPQTRALYLMVRQKPNLTDIKLQLAAAVWYKRALQGRAGLPAWLYRRLIFKPATLPLQCRKLKRRVSNLMILSSRKPLMSLLQNTPAAALHNWHTGAEHLEALTPQLRTQFWNLPTA